jgi:hypothetical protein
MSKVEPPVTNFRRPAGQMLVLWKIATLAMASFLCVASGVAQSEPVEKVDSTVSADRSEAGREEVTPVPQIRQNL